MSCSRTAAPTHANAPPTTAKDLAINELDSIDEAHQARARRLDIGLIALFVLGIVLFAVSHLL